MTTLLVTHTDCVLHEISPGHPESPGRIDAILDQLKKQDLFDHCLHADAPLADREVLSLGHDGAHIENMYVSSPTIGSVQLDPDTAMNPHSLTAALRGVGAGLLAVETVMEKRATNAFCVTRPPGHHAEHDRAMGFCFFGNVAIAAKHAIKKYGLERVAILDFDVHHGNGTEDIVDGNSHIPSGCKGADFRSAIESTWLPELESFKPELIIVSAGFDAHAEDPLAGLLLSDADFLWITQQIVDVADRHAEARVVSMLEGGYSLPALARSASAHVRVLMGLD